MTFEANNERLKQVIDDIDFEKLYGGRVSADQFLCFNAYKTLETLRNVFGY